jgi:hypothetical protein
MFHVFAWPCLFIFFHRSSPKYDLNEVGKSMIWVDPRPCKVIFCLLGAYKWNLFDLEKGNIEGDTNLAISFCAFGRSDMPLVRGGGNDF